MFKIAQNLREIQLEANVNEAGIGNVSEGNKVTFDVDAFPDEKFSGIVSQIRLSPQDLQNVVTYNEIILATLKDVCSFMNWPVGHAYLVDPNNEEILTPSSLWHISEKERFSKFVDIQWICLSTRVRGYRATF